MVTQRRIVPLTSALASKLRAGSTIQSLSQAAEECVCNSIDAGARHIHVQLNTRDLSLTVTDDGRGITADSFGCLAQQHATSKAREMCQSLASARSFGYRGTALASMAQSGRLDITSKAASAFETHFKALWCGKVLSSGLAADQRRTQGTVVRLSDFLCNQPVRRRQLTPASLKMEVALTRERVLRLSLAHPDIEFTLRNADSSGTLLDLRQGRSLQEMLPHILSCSGPSASHSALRLEGASTTAVHVTGFVTPPHAAMPSRAEQYTYVNRRFVHRCEPIRGLVESLHGQLQHSGGTDQKPGDTLGSGDRGTLIHETAIAKALARSEGAAQRVTGYRSFPAFVLFVECPPAMVDILAGAQATEALCEDWGPVLEATQAALLAAWAQFLPDRMLRGLHSAGMGVLNKDGGEQGRGRWRSEPSRAATADRAAGAEPRMDDGALRPRSEAAAQLGSRILAAGLRSSAPSMMARLCSEKRAAWHREPTLQDASEGRPTLPDPDSTHHEPALCSSPSLGDAPHTGRPAASSPGQASAPAKCASLPLSLAPGRSAPHPSALTGKDEIALLDSDEAELDRLLSAHPGAEPCKGNDAQSVGRGHHACVLAEGDDAQALTGDESETWHHNMVDSGPQHVLAEGRPIRCNGNHRMNHPADYVAGSLEAALWGGECTEEDWDEEMLGYLGVQTLSASCRARKGRLTEDAEPQSCRHNDEAPGIGPVKDYQGSAEQLPASVSNMEELSVERLPHPADRGAVHLRGTRAGQFEMERVERASARLAGTEGFHRAAALNSRHKRRRNSWPQPPPVKRRAVHTNPSASLRVLQPPCSSPSSGGGVQASRAMRGAPQVPTAAAVTAIQLSDDAENASLSNSAQQRLLGDSVGCHQRNDPLEHVPCASDDLGIPLPEGNVVIPKVALPACSSHPNDSPLGHSTTHNPEQSEARGTARGAFASCVSEEAFAVAVSVRHDPSAVHQSRSSTEVQPLAADSKTEGQQQQKQQKQQQQQQHQFGKIRDARMSPHPQQQHKCTPIDTGDAPILPPLQQQQHQHQFGKIRDATMSQQPQQQQKCTPNDAVDALILPPVQQQKQQQQQQHSVEAMFEAWENPCMRSAAAGRVVLRLEDLAPGLPYLTLPQQLDRPALMRAHVLRQVDRKFVILNCDGVLAALDQHAADERVQLEILRARLLAAAAAQPAGPSVSGSGGGISALSSDEGAQGSGPSMLRSVRLVQCGDGLLSPPECHLFEAYRRQATRWGWKAGVPPAAGGSLHVTHVPCIMGVTLTVTDLKVYLRCLEEAAGAALPLPPAAARLLNSKACRTAIMFGDALEISECRLLVQRLQGTQLCFRCAHGRPTIAPLADLNAVKRLVRARRAGGASTSLAGALVGKKDKQMVLTTSALCDKMKRVLEA